MNAPDTRGTLARERAEYSAGLTDPGDRELLAMVLGGADPLTQADAILDTLGGLRGLRGAAPSDLIAAGLTERAACAVAAACELGRRAATLPQDRRSPLRRPADVADYVRGRVGYDMRESFFAIGLDSRQCVVRFDVVAIGQLSSVECHPREIFAPMLTSRCHAVIVAHNHPSGDASPSEADCELTNRLVECGALLGVPVLDHVIVTMRESSSFAALGLIR